MSVSVSDIVSGIRYLNIDSYGIRDYLTNKISMDTKAFLDLVIFQDFFSTVQHRNFFFSTKNSTFVSSFGTWRQAVAFLKLVCEVPGSSGR